MKYLYLSHGAQIQPKKHANMAISCRILARLIILDCLKLNIVFSPFTFDGLD